LFCTDDESLLKRTTFAGGSAAMTSGRAKKSLRTWSFAFSYMNWPGAPPARIIFEITPPVTPGIVALSAFVLSFLPPASFDESAPLVRSPLRPVLVVGVAATFPSALRPLSFAIASRRGSVFSSAFVLSVIWNCRNACSCAILIARSRSLTPGMSIRMRSLPAFWMMGSETPMPSMRVRTTLSARSIASPLFATAPFDSSMSSARCMPPDRSSPSRRGMRRMVVS